MNLGAGTRGTHVVAVEPQTSLQLTCRSTYAASFKKASITLNTQYMGNRLHYKNTS